MGLRRKGERADGERWLEVDASMTGTLQFKDPVNLQINGKFEGSLETKGKLLVGEKAQVKATISGESIRIAGTIEGPISATQRLELQRTARVVGKISTPILVVEEGAVLQGTCEMFSKPTGGSQWMGLQELASYLEVDTGTILEWAKAGRLPAQKEGERWLFDRRRVESWLAQEKIR